MIIANTAPIKSVILNKTDSQILNYCKGIYGWHINKKEPYAIVEDIRSIIRLTNPTFAGDLSFLTATTLHQRLQDLAKRINTLPEYNRLRILVTNQETINSWAKHAPDNLVTEANMLQRSFVTAVDYSNKKLEEIDAAVNPTKSVSILIPHGDKGIVAKELEEKKKEETEKTPTGRPYYSYGWYDYDGYDDYECYKYGGHVTPVTVTVPDESVMHKTNGMHEHIECLLEESGQEQDFKAILKVC